MTHQEGIWESASETLGVSYMCGYCNSKVAPNTGYKATKVNNRNIMKCGHIYICSNCNKPTYVEKTPK